MPNKNIIAIDGPSGVGKGTLAQNIADHYGFAKLDTGSLYRAITMHLINSGFDMDKLTEDEAADAAQKISDDNSIIKYAKSPNIRSAQISKLTAPIASFEKVRKVIRKYQLDFGRNPPLLANGRQPNGAVVEGRDIGTVIFPDAPLKIYLTASAEVKAARRVRQYADEGIKSDYEEVLKDQKRRDEIDRTRKHGALKIAPDAIIIDNSDLKKSQTFALAKDLIKEKFGLS